MSRARPRVVFLDAATYGDISLRRFTETWDCTVHQVTAPGETAQRLAGHMIAVTNKVVIDKATLNSAEARDLKLIAVAATGTDIIDREQAARRDVKVCNVPGYATQSVAQFTMALMLELATRAGRYGDAVKLGSGRRVPFFPFSIIRQWSSAAKNSASSATATSAKPSRKWRAALGSRF